MLPVERQVDKGVFEQLAGTSVDCADSVDGRVVGGAGHGLVSLPQDGGQGVHGTRLIPAVPDARAQAALQMHEATLPAGASNTSIIARRRPACASEVTRRTAGHAAAAQ